MLELALWDANFYQPKLGGQSLIDQLQERGRLTNGDTLQYARGLFVDSYRGLRRGHHGGAWAGYRAMLMRFPDQRVSIGMTCDMGNADTMTRSEAVADVILWNLFSPPLPGATVSKGTGPTIVAPVRNAEYAASHFSKAEQALFTIKMVDGAAVLNANGATLPLALAARGQLVNRSSALYSMMDTPRTTHL